MWVAPTALLADVAVFTPVAPGVACSCSSTPRATACAPPSSRSVIPAGGVHWFAMSVAAPTANEATNMALLAVVVMLWVAWEFAEAVVQPAPLTSIGLAVSTPEYATMAPVTLAEPLPGLNTQS